MKIEQTEQSNYLDSVQKLIDNIAGRFWEHPEFLESTGPYHPRSAVDAEIEAIRLKGVNIVEFTFSLIKNEVSQIKDTEFHLDPREGSYDDWNELAKQLACDILTSRLYQTHPDILSEKERRIHL
jgi:hypothetical protein